MANETKNEATNLVYDQTAETVASRCAIQSRDPDPKNPDKKRQVWKQNIDYTAFTLAAFGISTPYAVVMEALGDNNEMVARVRYQDDKLQFIYDSQLARVEAAAKAKFAAGGEPAATVEELLSATKGGKYMEDAKAVRTAVTAYLLSKGNSEAQAAAVVSKMDTRVLKSADESTRKTIALVLTKVSEAVDLSAYQSVVDNILKAAEGEAVDLSAIEL